MIYRCMISSMFSTEWLFLDELLTASHNASWSMDNYDLVHLGDSDHQKLMHGSKAYSNNDFGCI